MSQNAESKFVNTKNKKFDFFKSCIKKEVWELFCKKFKISWVLRSLDVAPWVRKIIKLEIAKSEILQVMLKL